MHGRRAGTGVPDLERLLLARNGLLVRCAPPVAHWLCWTTAFRCCMRTRRPVFKQWRLRVVTLTPCSRGVLSFGLSASLRRSITDRLIRQSV